MFLTATQSSAKNSDTKSCNAKQCNAKLNVKQSRHEALGWKCDAQHRPVVLGKGNDVLLVRTSGNFALVSGLLDDDIVLTNGQAFVSPGDEIEYKIN